jgi:hypothetical protein
LPATPRLKAAPKIVALKSTSRQPRNKCELALLFCLASTQKIKLCGQPFSYFLIEKGWPQASRLMGD